MQQRLIPDEHRAGFVQPLAKAYPRRQNAINTRGTAIGTNPEPFLQTGHEIVCLTENEAGGEKDRRVVVDMLKDLINHASLSQRASGGRAKERGQPLRRCRLTGRQGVSQGVWLSSGESRQQFFSKGTRI